MSTDEAVPGVPEEARTDEIPDEAVEAACAAADHGWARRKGATKSQDRYVMRRSLTAAAPFLTAAARASGAVEGAAAERAEWHKLTAALGYGDGITEPAATPADLIDPLREAVSIASEHAEVCPVWCEDCDAGGQWERPYSCTRCNGSGCGPGTALGAYEPCADCDGDGRSHEPTLALAAPSDALAVRDRDAVLDDGSSE